MVRRSPWLIRLFTRHVKRFYLARDFHAVRLSRSGRPGPVPDGPLIVVLNHPSWWDPLVALVLTELFPDRAHYAPMDADALRRYRIFERLGMFGIEPGTMRRGKGVPPHQPLYPRSTADSALDHGSRPLCRRARTPAGHSTWSGSSRIRAWTRRSFSLWLWNILSGMSAVLKRSPDSVKPSLSNGAATEPWRNGVPALRRP